jgi:hypothetical protein
MAGPPADIVVVKLPAKGSVSLLLTPSGKADVERNGTVSQIHIEVDKLQPAQKLEPRMNAYVVWAVSPEGGFENIGELGVIDGKARMDATTRFDQFGILITAEPHFMVDRPNSVIAFRNQAPKADTVHFMPVSVIVGTYDYSKLQPVTAAVPGLVAQARAALQLASGVQADRYAESEFRLARVDLGTVEDMLGRSAPLDLVLPIASESIRLSQRSFVAARENGSSISQLAAERDAALARVQELQSAPAVKLSADYFDIRAGSLTPAGNAALTKIAAAVGFWAEPVRISCPENAVEILKRFLSAAGVQQNRVVIVTER